MRFHGVIDDHPVDFTDAAIWDLHEAVFRAGLAAVTDEPVTAVFSSEDYGDELAAPPRCRRRAGRRGPRHGAGQRHRGARRPGRRTGTTSRPPCGRGSLDGWSSSGPSPPAPPRSAGRSPTRFEPAGDRTGSRSSVPEQLRATAISKLAADRAAAVLDGIPPPAMEELTWRTDEMTAVAGAQNALEDAAAPRGGPVLVCDTDAFSVGIWHERYLGAPDPVRRRAGPPSPALPADPPRRGALRAGRLPRR